MFPNPNKANRPVLFGFLSLSNPAILGVMSFATIGRVAQRRFLAAEERRRMNMLQSQAQADAAAANGVPTIPIA